MSRTKWKEREPSGVGSRRRRKSPKPPAERCKHQNKAFPRSFRQAAETPARSLSPRASIIGSAPLGLDFNKPIVVGSLVHFIVKALKRRRGFFFLSEVDLRKGQLVITARL